MVSPIWKTSRLVLILPSVMLAGCANSDRQTSVPTQAGVPAQATVYHYDRAHGLPNRGVVTLEDFWKQMVNQRIALEAAGKRPDNLAVASWRQEWQEWYAILRHQRTPGFASSDFKTSEDMIAYIKRQRRAKGLPTYDS